MFQILNNKMNKLRRLYIFGLIALVCIIIGFAWAEQISLSTYYPSPYGVYRQLRVYPSDAIDPLNDTCSDKGAFYYDDSDSELYYCDGSDWQAFTCPPPSPPPLPVPGPWVYLGAPVLTNVVIPSGWYELDLSALVGGARQVVVLLKVKTNSNWGWYFYTKPFADTDAYSLDSMFFPMNALKFSGANEYQLCMVHTDNNAKVGIRVGGSFNPTWDVILVGYLPPESEI